MKIFEVKNDSGLHARPASIIVKITSKSESPIEFIKGDKKYNGKSIMSILSMGLKKGETVSIDTTNIEEDIIKELEDTFNKGFGEL